jgi:hypothetical protein
MDKQWTLELLESYRGMNIPGTVLSEREQLNALLAKHCRGPYDTEETEFGLGTFVEGAVGRPFDFGGIRLECKKTGPIYGKIYVRKTNWDVPLALYRKFLWTNVESAILACVSKLKKRKTSVDEEKLRSHLRLVEAEFLSDDLKSGALDPRANAEAMSVDKHAMDERRRIVVQYRIQGNGSGSDHDKRVEVENVLGEFLEAGDLGYCDGGDIGNGTMNVYCFVKPRQGVGKKIVELLSTNNLLESAVIAETDGEGEEQVIWPPDFQGEFQLI